MVATLDKALKDTNAETLDDTLGDVETLAQADTLAHTLTKGRPTHS